jgi:hypothetical protein
MMKSLRTKSALSVFRRTPAVLAMFLAAVVAPAGTSPAADDRRPDLGSCQRLAAPAETSVAFQVYAEGVQIYRWNGTSWVFVAPDAILFADLEGHGTVGTHYAGPTWESNSGSKVVGTVFDRCTPNPSAIAWLLLDAVSSSGPGIFQGVTHIQRLNTVGGLVPTAPGDVPGEEMRVPYTADYVFYRDQD